jgi:hypothetical protein
MLDLKAAFADWSESRKVGFDEDRSSTIGASEIGKCARKVAAEKALARQGEKPPRVGSNGAAVRGDVMEDEVLVPILKYAVEKQLPAGADLIWASQKDQRRFKSEAWRMSATLDGLIVNAPKFTLAAYGVSDIGSNCVVVEGKSFDPRKNENNFPEPAHVDQAIQQMGLVRASGEYNPTWAIIVYVNASFYDDIRVYPVRFTTEAFENLKKRASSIMGVNDPMLVRPEGKIAGGKECETCWMVDKCGGYAECVPQSVQKFDALPSGLRLQIMSAVGTLSNTERQMADLEARHEVAKATIKELLTAANTKNAKGVLKDGREFQISWRRIAPKAKTDMEGIAKALENSGYDIKDFQEKSKGKGGDALMVKVKEPA